jgi:hypothetical protein
LCHFYPPILTSPFLGQNPGQLLPASKRAGARAPSLPIRA